LWALRALWSCLPLRPGHPLNALRTLWAGWPLRSGVSLRPRIAAAASKCKGSKNR
jgi:hypothetical protein